MPKRFRFSARPWLAALLIPAALGMATDTALAEDFREKRAAYRTATIELQNILQKNPDDRNARSKLGLVNLEWGHGPLAEKELRRAIELGAPQETLQFPLAEALLIQGKYQEILDYLAPMALMPAQDQARLLAYRGDAWLGLNEPEKARAEYDTALKMDANSPQARLGLARLALAGNRIDEADQIIREVLAASPEDPKAWSLQGRLFEAAKQFGKAEASYSQAIALQRFSPVELASRAIVRINLNQLAEAQEDLDVLKEEAPEFFLTHYTAGLLNLRKGNPAEAQTALEIARKMNDRFASIYYYLGIAHLYQDHDYEAENYLVNFARYQPEVLESRLFLALLKFRAGEREAARTLLAPVLEQQPDNEFALKLMSDIEFAEGDSEAGFDYLGRIAKIQKPSEKTADSVGADLLKSEDPATLVARLDQALELDEKLARQVTTVVLGQIGARQFDSAAALIRKIRKKAPGNPLADHLTGVLHLAQKAPDKARKAFEAALDKKPGNPVISHELARLAVREKDLETARKLYEKALDIHPKDMATRLHLADLDRLEGQPKAMEERLAGVIRDYPTALQPRLILAAHVLNAGDPGRAQKLLEDIQQGYPDHAAFLSLLIQAQLENHEPRKAAATAGLFIRNQPRSPMAHYLLARAQAESQDTANMRKALETALALDPKFLPARYTLVKLLVAEKKMPEAAAALETLAREFPDTIEVLALQGWFATARNQPKEAVAAYRAAFGKLRNTRTLADLALAEWQAEDRNGAVATLEDWLRSYPADVRARIMVAEFYLVQKQDEAAIRHLEAVLKIQPQNVLAMNNLAWLYRKTAPEKALEVAQWAAAVAPKSPTVLDTLAMIELDRGQTDKALKLLKRAVEFAPRHKPTLYHLALALDRAGRHADAARVLKGLLADPKSFPEKPEAQALLDQLASGTVRASPQPIPEEP
jgi:putative PEP-CTERM system TPR-repeat lipoprotein